MASRICLLDEATINQIAAGEVVDRPASALKELIENALDAESTRVEIELEEGGLQLLRVVDNGYGMNPEELRWAVERHATSKISSAQDLLRVLSFGFRGEALSSIAAVSRLEIVSRSTDRPDGTRLTIDGGESMGEESAGAPVGTRVTVRDLFFNLPARRKFLKSSANELRAAVDLVSRLVLGNPQVAFKLRIPGRILIQSSGNNSLLEAVAAVYGRETASQMLPVDRKEMFGTERGRIWGYISRPSLSRNNRHQQSFLVNHRYIQSRLLQQAVGEAYRGLLPLGRFPVVILHLEIGPEMVDVNVHPAKMEVRFQDEKMISEVVIQAVRQALLTEATIPQINASRTARSEGTLRVQGNDVLPYAPAVSLRKEEPVNVQDQKLPYAPNTSLLGSQPERFLLNPVQETTRELELLPPTNTNIDQFEEELPRSLSSETENTVSELVSVNRTDSRSDNHTNRMLPELVPKAQIAGTYILAEGQAGLYILDQHAVHERILYEKILNSLENGHNYSQTVLFPETIELTPEERERFTQHIIIFRNLGFVIEHFGGNTFLLRGIPTFISGNGKEAFLDLLDYLQDKNRVEEQRLHQGLVAHLACRQAIKAADSLNQAEMESLILQMDKLENPYSCPHGRPTIIHLSQAELERRFHRS